ncbi:MAG: TetR family transcriptional regulator [Acidimicrobiia bacterium]|nr:TetR family transcriptional regulator [Acidimicrobiia bacterium]
MVNADAPASAQPGGSAAADTRARLIEAAVEVFLEHGYARTHVQDIARRADLHHGRHVPRTSRTRRRSSPRPSPSTATSP